MEQQKIDIQDTATIDNTNKVITASSKVFNADQLMNLIITAREHLGWNQTKNTGGTTYT